MYSIYRSITQKLGQQKTLRYMDPVGHGQGVLKVKLNVKGHMMRAL